MYPLTYSKVEEEREEKLLKALRDELVEKEGVMAILRRRLEEVEEKRQIKL